MTLLTTDWDFRALWASLPLQTKLYLLCLLAAAIYSCISLLRALVQITKLPRIALDADVESTYHRISARLRNLRQLHLLFLLLLGLFLTDEAFRTVRSFTLSKMSLEAPTIAKLLDPLLGFAFISLLVLTVLHSIQWLASSRLEASLQRKNNAT
jgi:hypothetical protein